MGQGALEGESRDRGLEPEESYGCRSFAHMAVNTNQIRPGSLGSTVSILMATFHEPPVFPQSM